MGRTGPSSENPEGSVPEASPQITPQAYSPYDHSFTLQATMEMQKTLGKLEQAVTTLTEESKNSREKLGKIDKDIHAAKVTIKVVGVILAAIGSGALALFWKIWTAVSPLIQIKLPHP